MGEGGCVLTDRPALKTLVESFRDWGRDCWCDPGKDNTCGKRFDWQLGELPHGYDHKYIYSHIGYNLKVTDMQAAVGVAQLDKLPGVHRGAPAQLRAAARGARATSRTFFVLPEATPGTEPSWFGFPMLVRAGRAVHAPRADRPPRVAEDRHPAGLRRQPAAPAGLRGVALPRGRRPGQHRPRHERRPSGSASTPGSRRDARLRGGHHPVMVPSLSPSG